MPSHLIFGFSLPEKEVKSSSNSCQRTVEGRPVVKSSPPTSPSSLPSSTPPMQPMPYPSAGQLAWLQNSFASYLPIYEQYYRYYYGYGMPAPNHPQYPIGIDPSHPNGPDPTSSIRHFHPWDTCFELQAKEFLWIRLRRKTSPITAKRELNVWPTEFWPMAKTPAVDRKRVLYVSQKMFSVAKRPVVWP